MHEYVGLTIINSHCGCSGIRFTIWVSHSQPATTLNIYKSSGRHSGLHLKGSRYHYNYSNDEFPLRCKNVSHYYRQHFNSRLLLHRPSDIAIKIKYSYYSVLMAKKNTITVICAHNYSANSTISVSVCIFSTLVWIHVLRCQPNKFRIRKMRNNKKKRWGFRIYFFLCPMPMTRWKMSFTRKNLFDNQVLLWLLIISFILMTVMSGSGVTS